VNQSAPNTWLYGGILETFDWEAQPGTLDCWDGESRYAQPGDRVRMVLTGGMVWFVDVEPMPAKP
jgi:hypothetical protein